ncbi:MAG: hypothetical protein CM15mP51_24030 [Porticoccaceae bacterium]|nr:MAG: hypothetical protein CM15mP51_24030 [Porticoccaceae bacterium]
MATMQCNARVLLLQIVVSDNEISCLLFGLVQFFHFPTRILLEYQDPCNQFLYSFSSELTELSASYKLSHYYSSTLVGVFSSDCPSTRPFSAGVSGSITLSAFSTASFFRRKKQFLILSLPSPLFPFSQLA